jgi:hypothetical protein
MHPWKATFQVNDQTFGRTVVAPLPLLLLLLATHVALKALFFSDWFLQSVALPLEAWTEGAIRPATLAGSVQLVLLVGLGVLYLGRLKPVHFGLRLEGTPRLALLVAAIWVVAHLVCLGLGARPSGLSNSMPLVIGGILEATAGSAVPEELFYRGFLLVQVFLLFRLRAVRWSPDVCLAVSVILVQLYFAAHHIPAAMRAGLPIDTALLWLTQTALVGGMMAALFIQTGNVVMAVAAHTLINLSIPILDSPVPPQLVLLVLVCVTMLTGRWIFGRDLLGRQVLSGS